MTAPVDLAAGEKACEAARILVTGSRYLTNRSIVRAALVSAWRRFQDRGPVMLVHGGATGADTMASDEWRKLRLPSEEHPADWERHGKAAGPLRNREMVAAGADLCLAFFIEGVVSRGTLNCSGLARAAGIPVLVYTQAIAKHVQVTQ